MSFHKEDYEKGAINENDFLPVIQQHFNDLTIEKIKERFNPFDFTNNSNLLIELNAGLIVLINILIQLLGLIK